MPWKQGYTISDEIGLRDDQVRWPDGNRCCVTVVVDLSVARGPEGIRATDLMHPDAYFAAHDGLDQLLAVLKRFGITATFAVPRSSRSFVPIGSGRCSPMGTRSRQTG